MPKRRSKTDTSSLADQVSSKRRPNVPKTPETVQENGTSEGPSQVVSPGSCSSVESVSPVESGDIPVLHSNYSSNLISAHVHMSVREKIWRNNLIDIYSLLQKNPSVYKQKVSIVDNEIPS
jgi:hypothetical protein